MSNLYQSLSHSKGAGHIMPIFRNPSRFTIGGPTCSRRLFLYCAECIVKDGDYLVCESPRGHSIAIPVWMTDQAVCAGFSVGPPAVSLPALRALRTFLDGLRSTAECAKPSESTSPTEASDEAKKQDKPKAGRAVSGASVNQRCDPSCPGRKSRNGTQKSNRPAATKRGTRRRRSPKRR